MIEKPTPEHKDIKQPSIEILDATPEDVEGILDVQKETWLATYPNEELGITKEEIESRFANTQERIERWNKILEQQGENSHTWVAKESQNVIGFSSANRKEEHRLQAIYVSPEYHGKGVGRQLATKVLKWLGDDKDIYVNVASYNINAIEFYRKLGFEEVDPIPESAAAKLPSGKIIPEITMARKVKEGNND
jgi:ribosomal protein S18 acetylase RimI-like enzyme